MITAPVRSSFLENNLMRDMKSAGIAVLGIL